MEFLREERRPDAHVPPMEPKRHPKAASMADLTPSEAPNIHFHNARQLAGKRLLSPRLALPECIHFYVRLKFVRVGFPFPPGINTKRYLHKACVQPGREEAGPVAKIRFDSRHIIGLAPFQTLTFCQLVLEVPSTATINPTIHPTKLSFHPQSAAQLHRGGARIPNSDDVSRVIVPVWPHLVSRSSLRSLQPRRCSNAKAASLAEMWGRSDGVWVGTFGSSDGRLGPAFVRRLHEGGLPAPTAGAPILGRVPPDRCPRVEIQAEEQRGPSNEKHLHGSLCSSSTFVADTVVDSGCSASELILSSSAGGTSDMCYASAHCLRDTDGSGDTVETVALPVDLDGDRDAQPQAPGGSIDTPYVS